MMRVAHYPQREEFGRDEEFGQGEHTDYGCLTMLAQDEVPGALEVLAADGVTWIQVPPIKGTFVINIGDMMEHWTAGRYRATRHRVRNVEGVSRFSAPFFFEPSFDTVVRPISGVARGHSSNSNQRDVDARPIHYGEHMTQRFEKSFAVPPL
eukprot:TRINITY_DN56981_c0_g1_i1.p1 TRINITY_DN56981_c0_g1~~TRINITY_DN56981_c0_g1_i1.p1  ORF type:complete len:152 (+),score=23.95 TRINITY_DN56981_c0_g1_i1:88-543(+)